MSEKRRYLVTGASGFLGRHVLSFLSDKRIGSSSYALVRDLQAWKDLGWTPALNNVVPLQGTLWNCHDSFGSETSSGVSDGVGIDGIFHLAALVRHSRRDVDEMIQTNVDGTLAMVRLAAQCRARLIFVSTSGVVGCFDSMDQWADEHTDYCVEAVKTWPYYRSKLEAERQAHALAHELGVEMITVRPPVILGPGDHRFRSTRHILKVLRGQLPFLTSGGINFVDVRDTAQALVQAMELKSPREVYHLPGTVCSIETFFDMVESVSGAPRPKMVLPYSVAHGAAWMTERLLRVLGGRDIGVPDPVVVEMASRYWGLRSRFVKKDLGFETRSPLQTLADTVLWLRRNHEA